MLRRFCVAASALILIFCAVRLEVPVAVAESQVIGVPQDYATIQAAVDAASPGDTISVSSGTYFENVCVNKSLCLVGESRSTTVVSGSGGEQSIPTFWITASKVLIGNLTIIPTSYYGLRFGPAYGSPYAWLHNVTQCTVADSTIEGGVHLYYCHNSTILRSSLHNICLVNSCDNVITYNHISEPQPSGLGVEIFSEYRRVGLVSDRNAVAFNNITGCGDCGVWICASSENVIVGNNITDNGKSIDSSGGLETWELEGTESNMIFHNNFANNTKRNAYTLTRVGQESWDAGYPSGGNYYDNYTGADLYSGPLQNQPGSDGIGDTPYPIPSITSGGDKVNVDRYPLMTPCVANMCSATVAPLKTVAGEGVSLPVSLDVTNPNVDAEQIRVTVRANGTVACDQSFLVERYSTAAVSVAWNTAGFEKGTYRVLITATTAWTLTVAEYELSVFLTIPGDVDASRLVDIYDVVALTAAYEARTGEPEYGLDKDVNSDGIIDIYDVVYAASHYEETW